MSNLDNKSLESLISLESNLNDTIISLYDICNNEIGETDSLSYTYHIYESLPYIALTSLILGYTDDDINGIFNNENNDDYNAIYPLLYRNIYNELQTHDKAQLLNLFAMFLRDCKVHNNHRVIKPLLSIYKQFTYNDITSKPPNVFYMDDHEVLSSTNDFIFELYKPNVIVNQLSIMNSLMISLPKHLYISDNEIINYKKDPDIILLWILYFMLKIEQFINSENRDVKALDIDNDAEIYIYNIITKYNTLNIKQTNDTSDKEIKSKIISDAKLFIHKYNSLSDKLYKTLFQLNYVIKLNQSLINYLSPGNKITTMTELITVLSNIEQYKHKKQLNLYANIFGNGLLGSQMGFIILLNKLNTTDSLFEYFETELSQKLNGKPLTQTEYTLNIAFNKEYINNSSMSIATALNVKFTPEHSYLIRQVLNNYMFKAIIAYNINEPFIDTNNIYSEILSETTNILNDKNLNITKIRIEFYYKNSDNNLTNTTDDIYINITFLTLKDKTLTDVITFSDIVYNVIKTYKLINRTNISNSLNQYTLINCKDATKIILPNDFLSGNNDTPINIDDSNLYLIDAFIGAAIYDYANKVSNLLSFQSKETSLVPTLGISIPYDKLETKANNIISHSITAKKDIGNIVFLPSVSKLEYIESNIGSVPVKLEGLTDYIYQNLGTPASGIKLYFHIANVNDIIEVLTLFSQLSPIDAKRSYTAELSTALLTQIRADQNVTIDSLYENAKVTSQNTYYPILKDLVDAYKKDTMVSKNITISIKNPIVNAVGIYDGTISQMQVQAIEGTSAFELMIAILPSKYDFLSGNILKESKTYDIDDHIAMVYASMLYSNSHPNNSLSKWYINNLSSGTVDLKYINLATDFADNVIGELLVLFSICEYFMDVSNGAIVGSVIKEFNKENDSNTDTDDKIGALASNVSLIIGNAVQDAMTMLATQGSLSILSNAKILQGLLYGVGSAFNVISALTQSYAIQVDKGNNDTTYLAISLDTIILTGLPKVLQKLYFNLVANFKSDNNSTRIVDHTERVKILFDLLETQYSVALRTLFSMGFSVENVVDNSLGLKNIVIGGKEAEKYVWVIDVQTIPEQNLIFTTSLLENMEIEDKIRYNISKLKSAFSATNNSNKAPVISKLCIYPSVAVNLHKDDLKNAIALYIKKFSSGSSFDVDSIINTIESTRIFKYISNYITSYRDNNVTMCGMNNLYVAARTLLYNTEQLSKFANMIVVALGLDDIFYCDLMFFIHAYLRNKPIDTEYLKTVKGNDIFNDDLDYINKMRIFIGGDNINDILYDLNSDKHLNLANLTITDITNTEINLNTLIIRYSSLNSLISCFDIMKNAIFMKYTNSNVHGANISDRFFKTNVLSAIKKYTDVILNTDFVEMSSSSAPTKSMAIVTTCVGFAGLILFAAGIFLGSGISLPVIIGMMLTYQLIRVAKQVLSSLHATEQALEDAMNSTSRMTFSLILYAQLKYNTGLIYYNIFSKNVISLDVELTFKLQILINQMLQYLIKSIFSAQMQSLPCSVAPILYGFVLNNGKFAIFNPTVLFTNEFASSNKQIRNMMSAIMLSNIELKSESKKTMLGNYNNAITTQIYNFVEELSIFKDKLTSFLNSSFGDTYNTEINDFIDSWKPITFDNINNHVLELDTISGNINKLNDLYAKTITKILNEYDESYQTSNPDEKLQSAEFTDIVNKYNQLMAESNTIQDISSDVSDTSMTANSDNYIAANKAIDDSITRIKDSMYTNAGVYGTESYLKIAKFMDDFSFDKLDYMGFSPVVDNVYYKIFLIKENESEFLLYDGLYTYNSVISIDVVKHEKDPIRTLKLVLNNPFKILNNINTTRVISANNVDLYGSNYYASIYLQPGAKIKVLISRNLITPVYNEEFIGEIVNIQGNNPLTIIAQSSAGAMLNTKYHMDDVYKYRTYDQMFTVENVIYNLMAKILYEIDKTGKLSEYNYLDIGGVYVDSSATQFIKTTATKKPLIQQISDIIKSTLLTLMPVIAEEEKAYDIVSKKSNILENIKVQSEFSVKTVKKLASIVLQLISAEKTPKYFVSYNTTPYEDLKKILMRTQNNIISVKPYDERETIYIGPTNGYYKYTNKYDVLNSQIVRTVSLLDAYILSGARLKIGSIDSSSSDNNVFDIFSKYDSNKTKTGNPPLIEYVYNIISNIHLIPIEIKKEALFVICDFFDSFITIIKNNTIITDSGSYKKAFEMNLYSDLGSILMTLLPASSNDQTINAYVKNDIITLYLICTLIFGIPENIFDVINSSSSEHYLNNLPKATAIYYLLYVVTKLPNNYPYEVSLTNMINILLGKHGNDDIKATHGISMTIDDLLIMFALNLLDFKSRTSFIFATDKKADKSYFTDESTMSEYDYVMSLIKNDNVSGLYQHINSVTNNIIHGEYLTADGAITSSCIKSIYNQAITNKELNYSLYNTTENLSNNTATIKLSKAQCIYSSTLIYEFIDVVMNELYSMFTKASPSHKPIRQCHVLLSKLNIIANNIQLARGPNKVSMIYDGKYEANKVKLNNVGKSPSFTKIIDLPFNRSLPESMIMAETIDAGPVEGVIFPAIAKKEYNYQIEPRLVALAHGQEIIENYYSGDIIVLGKNYEPGDICYLYDEVNELYGYFKIKDVTTSYSIDTGYISTLTPAVIVAETNQDVNTNAFLWISAIDRMISLSNIIITASNIFSIAYNVFHNYSPAKYSSSGKPAVMTKVAASMDALGINNNIFSTGIKFIKTSLGALWSVISLNPKKITNFIDINSTHYTNIYNNSLNIRKSTYEFMTNLDKYTKTITDSYIKSLNIETKPNTKLSDEFNKTVTTKLKTKILNTFNNRTSGQLIDKKFTFDDTKDQLFGCYDSSSLQNEIRNIITETLLDPEYYNALESYDNTKATINKTALNITDENSIINFPKNFYRDVVSIYNESDATATETYNSLSKLFGKSTPLTNTIFSSLSDASNDVTGGVVQYIFDRMKVPITVNITSELIRFSLTKMIMPMVGNTRDRLDLASPYIINGLFYKNMPFMANLDGSIFEQYKTITDAFIEEMSDTTATFIYNLSNEMDAVINQTVQNTENMTGQQ